MIFQHFNLLSARTAAGNVALPLEVAGYELGRSSPLTRRISVDLPAPERPMTPSTRPRGTERSMSSPPARTRAP
jgi:hypothetical protein